jgi:hypothetical protein
MLLSVNKPIKNMTTRLITLALLNFLVITPSVASTKKPNKKQTEEWIVQHVQAWDDRNAISVEAKDCRIIVSTSNSSSLINMEGLLFPIEVLSLDRSTSPTVRLRVKDRYSGDYGMIKKCPSNETVNCKNSKHKWKPLSYQDLNITGYVEYFGRDEGVNNTKAKSLVSALSHYAKLCGAAEFSYSF